MFQRLEWLKRVLMHFLTTRIKSLKKYFLTSGVVKNGFWCISRPPESSPYKRLFLTSEVVENVFLCICAYFQTTRIKSLINYFFKRLEWFKTCFYAFAHTSRPPESSHWKIIFFTSGVVKTCFDAFPDHQNQVLQKLFF